MADQELPCVTDLPIPQMHPSLYLLLSTLISAAFKGNYTYTQNLQIAEYARILQDNWYLRMDEPLITSDYFDDMMEIYHRHVNLSKEESHEAFRQFYCHILAHGDYDFLIAYSKSFLFPGGGEEALKECLSANWARLPIKLISYFILRDQQWADFFFAVDHRNDFAEALKSADEIDVLAILNVAIKKRALWVVDWITKSGLHLVPSRMILEKCPLPFFIECLKDPAFDLAHFMKLDYLRCPLDFDRFFGCGPDVFIAASSSGPESEEILFKGAMSNTCKWTGLDFLITRAQAAGIGRNLEILKQAQVKLCNVPDHMSSKNEFKNFVEMLPTGLKTQDLKARVKWFVMVLIAAEAAGKTIPTDIIKKISEGLK